MLFMIVSLFLTHWLLGEVPTGTIQ
jgi:hypothetical protein